MKKILLILFLSIFLVQGVNAETFNLTVKNKTFEDFYAIEVTHPTTNQKIKLYDYFMNIFNSQTKYKYYVMEFYSYADNYFYNTHFRMFNDLPPKLTASSGSKSIYFSYYPFNMLYGYHGDFYSFDSESGAGDINFTIGYNTYELLDTNVDIILQEGNYNITGLYNSTIKINSGDRIPSLKDLSNEDIRNKYINGESNYTEVNLDDYEYVVLSLKDYTKKEAFDTTLKVKGMIGITPVYEFGTVEKEYITDRCNLTYSEFTDHRLFILKNDLLNNAVYYVKSCEENSSFKFNSSLFNITYITADNANAPSIAVGNNIYNIIPFNKLTTTANSNEENNYIPGESGSSLSDAVNNSTNAISDIWNSITSFMGLVTKFFNTLPEEFRYLSITAFTTLVMIAIIKFLKG